MKILYNVVTDRAYIENDGVHTEAVIERVTQVPADEIKEKSALEIAQDAFKTADSALSGFIANMKADIEQKNELVILGIVSATEVSEKKAYYKTLYEALKSDYDQRKAELKAML